MNKFLLTLVVSISFICVSFSQNIWQGFSDLGNSVSNNNLGKMLDFSTCNFVPELNLNQYIPNIAFTPNGNLYTSRVDSIFQINILTGEFNFLNSFNVNSSTVEGVEDFKSDNNGILYLITRNSINIFEHELKIFNPVSNTFENKGDIILDTDYFVAGLTYKDGKFYIIAAHNSPFENPRIWELNLDNPSQSTFLFEVNYVIPPPLGFLLLRGIVSEPIACDSSKTYFFGQDWFGGYYYDLDFQTGIATFQCHLSYMSSVIYALEMNAIASPDEPFFIPCDPILDLDEDDSSATPPIDYAASEACDSVDYFLENTDLYLDTSYPVDSIVVWISNPLDGLAEVLQSYNSNGFNITTSSNGNQIILSNNGNASDNDFLSVLANLEYSNGVFPNHTEGNRNIHFVVFSNGGMSDTATAFLPLPIILEAGNDAVLNICKDALLVDLFQLLEDEPDAGGTWLPTTNSNDGWLNPQLDVSADYQYIQNNGNCPNDTAVVAVTIYELPIVSLGADQVICDNISTTLSATSTSIINSYLWQDGSDLASLEINTSGVFWVEITDENGCEARDSILITMGNSVVVIEPINLCIGESLIFNGEMIESDTSICAVMLSQNGCDSTHCLEVAFMPIFTDTTSASICEGESYLFENEIYTTSGLHTISLFSQNGCDSLLNLDLTIFSNPTPEIIGGTSICEGESSTLFVDASDLVSQIWSTGENTSMIEVNNAGEYFVTVTNGNNCTSMASVDIEIFDNIIELGADENIEWGDSILIGQPSLFFPIDTFYWSPTVSLFSPNQLQTWVSPTENTTYQLTVQDANGCWITDDISITVNNEKKYYIPNAFSPNDDGKNDFFTIYTGKGVEEILSFRLFNRWGANVFSRENITTLNMFEGWNGIFNGKKSNEGVYVYLIKIKYVDGVEEWVHGDFTLMK